MTFRSGSFKKKGVMDEGNRRTLLHLDFKMVFNSEPCQRLRIVQEVLSFHDTRLAGYQETVGMGLPLIVFVER